MKYLSFLIVSILILCSSVSAQKYPATTAAVNGIKTVSNPEYPKDGIYDLVIDELFTLGTNDEKSGYYFVRPFEGAMDKEGNFYILDSQGKIIVFDKKGNFIRQFGQKGSGPGDFNFPSFFKITNDNKIVLLDCTNNRICYLDLYGKYLSGSIYKKMFMFLFLDSKNTPYSVSDEYKLPQITEKMQYTPITKIVQKYNKETEQWNPIASFEGEMRGMKRSGNYYTSESGINAFYWNVSPKDFLISGFIEKYEFTKHSLDGKPLLKFGRKYSLIAKRDYNEAKDLSKYLSVFTRFNQCDAAGNYWVNLDLGDQPEYYIYDIFSADGIYLKQVYSKYRVNMVKGNFAFSVINNKDYTVNVKAFKYSLKKREK